jgi:hypothetical protein
MIRPYDLIQLVWTNPSTEKTANKIKIAAHRHWRTKIVVKNYEAKI